MTADPEAIHEALASVAETLVKALASVASSNPGAATQACDLFTRISTSFILQNIGPQAARDELAAVWLDLDAAIAEQNCGSGTLS
jgi:hypothetical protein